MEELHNILTPTDLSAPSRHAAERAALIARDTRARLALLHVLDLAPLEQLRQWASLDPANVEAQVVDQMREKLRGLATSIHDHIGILPAVTVSTGELLTDILGFAKSLPGDLVVFGARGSSFMRHILLGSTAERLLRLAEQPMLVVKQPPHEPYRNILVAVDFSPASQRSIEIARMLAPAARISLLHSFEVPFEGYLRHAGVSDTIIGHYRSAATQDAYRQLDQLCRSTGLDGKLTAMHVQQGDVSQRILEAEQELDCDLIVVGKHGKDALQELLLGSTTKHILAESQGDVLVTN